MNKFYAMFLGLAIAGSGMVAHAQLVRGGNGSVSELAPLKITKKTLRKMAPKGMKLRIDHAKARQQYFVLAFDQTLTPEAEQSVSRHAAYISNLPDNLYMYAAPDAEKAVAAIRKALDGRKDVKLLTVGALPIRYKLINVLLEASDKGTPLPTSVVEKGIVVSTVRPEDRQTLEATLDKWYMDYDLTSDERVRLLNPTIEQVFQVAALPFVIYLQPYETPVPLAFHMNYITEANRIQIVNYDLKGPIGRGTTFANWEPYGGEDRWTLGSYGRNAKEARDKSINAHGTNCGLIVAGADNLVEGQTQGMAPGMQIIAMNDKLAPWGLHHNGVETALTKGFSPLVSNHSVGWNINPVHPDLYLESSALIDDIIYRNNNYMCCYPTGNWAYGKSTYPPYTDPDYGRITGHIKTNKNGLAIHSTIYPGVDVTWANFGPTADGRMKPDICAQGSGGTSYASPGVAGLIGVLLEQFNTTYPTLSHRIDVCKAVMLNTALDVRTYANSKEEGRGIDYRTGFGEINPPAAVKTIADRRISFDQKVKQGETNEMKLSVPEGQTELRVMLYWNDPAATVGAQKALINDLDLEVVTPSGEVVLPWTLDPSPQNVTKPAQRAVNRRDNAEQVIITASKKGETLAAGEYIIRVKGHHVPRGPQNFVTTWQIRERGIIWTSIPKGYRISPGQTVLLSWDMTVSTEEDLLALNFHRGSMTPSVYYRLSPESEWIRASAVQDLCYWTNVGSKQVNGAVYGKNFFKWKVPQNMSPTSTLQFKVTVDDLEAISASAQVGEHLSERPKILAFSDNKIKLSWKPTEKTKEGKYFIYALYDKYMQVVDSVDLPITEKEITAPKGVKWSQDQFFSVAVFDSKAKSLGRRSMPVGFDPFNSETTDSEYQWNPSYLLCVGDELNLKTNLLEGNVRWYLNSKPIEGEAGTTRVYKVTRDVPGKYHYTISDASDKVIYTSPQTTINASTVELADTAKWGDFVWEGYAFHKAGGSASNLPLLTEKLPFYGKFTLSQLSFDSEHTLFPWSKGTISDIIGYEGCPTTGFSEETVIVMKRKGFTPGKYTLKFERASGVAQIFIRDGNGSLIKHFDTPVNSHTSNIGTMSLDENSTIELHWTGNHLIFSATLQIPTSELSISPARVVPRPSFWLDPNKQEQTDGSEVKRLADSYPQAETFSLVGQKGARFNPGGSNYNATLDFNGHSGYIGGMRKANTSNNTTDFIVLNAVRGSGNERIASFGSGQSDEKDKHSYALTIDREGRYSSVRENVWLLQSKGRAGTPRIVTVRHSKKLTNISINGENVDGSAKVNSEKFNLQKMTIGTSFDAASPHYFRGQLAELVHYDVSLPAMSENRIRTYLAIKHGISLDHDYMMTPSIIIYPVVKGGYKHQIAGIGRDDKSRLNQKLSRGTHTNGTPAMLTIALGDWAETNTASTAEFAQNLTYYVAGANTNGKPNQRIGDTSMVSYQLRRTQPADATPETLSFYLPATSFNREGKTAYIEFSTKELTDPHPMNGSTFVELKPYAANPSLIRAIYTPVETDTYFRVVWKDTVPNAIEGILLDTDRSVSYDVSTATFEVKVKDAQTLDVIDLQGRTLHAKISVKNGRSNAVRLPAGVYVVKVSCKDGSTHAVKVNVAE